MAQSQQKAELAEEELANCHMRIAKLERGNRGQMSSRQSTGNEMSNMAMRQLTLKQAEHDASLNELKHQKLENTKLREKVRELLKKVAEASSSVSTASSDETDKRMMQQQHQIELARQSEQSNSTISRLQEQLSQT